MQVSLSIVLGNPQQQAYRVAAHLDWSSWVQRFLRWLGIRHASFAALPPFPVCDLARAALSRTLLGDPFGPHQQTRRRQPSSLTHFALPKMPRGTERGAP